ncbi:GNAT family N-acetyltransferase [Myxococcus llanfairpwllgwyngyllgogerychwyrndrobwllllantysiliogogogochensis]|uniref:GNAT family N-acetyltransferase n=1 Tax=Myxococcus llanfairpwllgwyngyllgogerychwyrndrobwllllantysiliogogogochensis TaxID=2590453 RepID=A0A540WND7_9BACT|nr:GNAT family N-acetyltransferase [Myxococcus llanfairpwllgwyngyllgogerychwyrndrobwllllantysiliogogogochensis]TQF10539.1 GNAT family N-acetyltransferase [Myxococcus llanfairpwllgwyngyllgogerychwyrndrobwllllantysiliogogogochensis]
MLRLRPYRDVADHEAMARLVVQAWAERGPHVECAVGDLTWRLLRNAQVLPREDISLWERAPGQLAGFAWAYGNGDVDLLVHPLEHADAFAVDVLPWVRARHGRTPQPATLWALESNGPLLAALRRLGLRTTGGCYLHLALPLHALPPSPPPLPEGYRVRAMRGPEEVAARALVHRRGFGTERVTTEVYARLMEAPRYQPALDLVIEAPDGSLAACALGWLDEANAVGEFEPVACAPEHRRRGLGRALLHEGLGRMRGLGARQAVVYAFEGNPVSVALYQSSGFTVVDRNLGHTLESP